MSESPPFIEDTRSTLGLIIGSANEMGISSNSKKSNVDIKLQYGDFQENASATISYNSNYAVQYFRSECSSSSEEILFVVSFGVSSNLDSEEVKEVVDQLLPPVLQILPFKTLKYKLDTITESGGQRVMRLIFSINDSEVQLTDYFNDIFKLIGLDDGDILKFLFSHSLQDKVVDNNFKWSAQLKCSAYRDFIQLILNIFNANADEQTKAAIKFLNGFKHFKFELEFDDVEKSMKQIVPILFKQEDNWSFDWVELKEGIIGPILIKALLKLGSLQPTEEKESDGEREESVAFDGNNPDHILNKFPPYYTKLCRNLTGLSKISLVVGNVQLSIGFTGLDFVHLLPVTRTDIENILNRQKEGKGMLIPLSFRNSQYKTF